MISSALELHRYATGRQTRVVTAMTLLKSHLFRWLGCMHACDTHTLRTYTIHTTVLTHTTVHTDIKDMSVQHWSWGAWT